MAPGPSGGGGHSAVPATGPSGKKVGLLVGGVVGVVVLSIVGVSVLAWQGEWFGRKGVSYTMPTQRQTQTFTPPPATPENTPSPTPTRQETPGRSSTPSPTPQEILEKNPLYSAGPLPSVGCVESRSMPTDKASVERYYRNIIDCLNRSWPTVVEKAGFEFREPKLVVWSDSVETPCGDYIRAFYCPANETIYMKWDDDVNQYNKYPEEYQKVYARMFASFQTAHEYGHHIQALTGIFDAYAQLRHQAPDLEEELELSRRLELQSSCLGSIFWGANQPTYPITGESRRQWMHLVNHYGDEYGEQRDHGSEKNHGPWSIGGFRTEDPKSCNTWTAPAEKVS